MSLLPKNFFGPFPGWLCAGLNPCQQIIYTWLLFHCKQEGKKDNCSITYKTLASETGMCLRSVIRHIEILEKKGYIAKFTRLDDEKGNLPNQYTVLIPHGKGGSL